MAETLFRLGRVAMGSRFEVILRGDGGDRTDLLAAAGGALDEVERLDRQLSHYRPTSDICDINARAAAEPVRVEPRLFDLLTRCAALSSATGGAFDITSGPLIRCWGFFDKAPREPPSEEIDVAAKLAGMQNVVLDPETETIRFRRPGVAIHLGAIGKGYAVECAASVLRNLGIRSALIHGGHSSIEAIGPGPGGEPWSIGLKHPLREDERLAVLALEDYALSSSGSTGDFFEIDGRRYSHLIDPRTGWPAEGLLSVSVIAASAMETDALSTAFFVMGIRDTAHYCLEHPDVAALLLPQSGSGRDPQLLRLGIEFEHEGAQI